MIAELLEQQGQVWLLVLLVLVLAQVVQMRGWLLVAGRQAVERVRVAVA